MLRQVLLAVTDWEGFLLFCVDVVSCQWRRFRCSVLQVSSNIPSQNVNNQPAASTLHQGHSVTRERERQYLNLPDWTNSFNWRSFENWRMILSYYCLGINSSLQMQRWDFYLSLEREFLQSVFSYYICLIVWVRSRGLVWYEDHQPVGRGQQSTGTLLCRVSQIGSQSN